MRPTRRPSSARASRRSSWPRRSRATAWAKRAKAATSPTTRRSSNEEELREFRTPVRHSDFRRGSGQGAVLQAAGRQRGDEVPARAPRGAGRLRAQPADDASRRPKCRGSTSTRSSSAAARARRCRRRWPSCGCCASCCKDKQIGKYVVPIVPDESRTFGMEGMFREIGIYAHVGQLYEPVDSRQSDVLQGSEGRPDSGRRHHRSRLDVVASSPRARRTRSHGINMIPFFIYYSMFGFQRIGDLIWAAGDMRAKGFLIGGTAGRTTLNGEGLQHQDGHSLLNAIAFPTVRAYDPAYAYEIAVDRPRRHAADVRGRRDGHLLPDGRQRELRASRDARRASKKASSAACTSSRTQRGRRRTREGQPVRQRRDPAATCCGRRRCWPRSTASPATSGA